jgi:PNKP adenylyltransferase domain, ligase domain
MYRTPVPETEWVNNTMCLDTGCVFGGRLTAFNHPERTVVSVPAARIYYAPAKPFPVEPPSGHPQAHREPDVLDIRDVSGSRVIQTAYLPRVGVREDHATAALEVMSRFTVDPRWLLYLPPTMRLRHRGPGVRARRPPAMTGRPVSPHRPGSQIAPAYSA